MGEQTDDDERMILGLTGKLHVIARGEARRKAKRIASPTLRSS